MARAARALLLAAGERGTPVRRPTPTGRTRSSSVRARSAIPVSAARTAQRRNLALTIDFAGGRHRRPRAEFLHHREAGELACDL